MKNHITIPLCLLLLSLMYACSKPMGEGNGICGIPAKATGVNIRYLIDGEVPNIYTADSIATDTIQLHLHLSTARLNEHSFPPCPNFYDSVIGHIDSIQLYKHYTTEAGEVSELINDAVAAKIIYRSEGESGIFEYNLNRFNELNAPCCFAYMRLQCLGISQHTGWHRFTIKYYDDKGTHLQASTQPIYILPTHAKK